MASRAGLATKVLLALVVAAAAFGVGHVVGSVGERDRAAADLDDTIAMSWGDGRYGKAFYGMRVFLEPGELASASGPTVSVRAEVRIGRGNGMRYDAGPIGVASSRADAVARFGTITWREDGVHVGSPGHDEYMLERTRVEAHR
jgi:hypothetical protein